MSLRVMFTAAAGVGHVFPQVPLAWALRAAGHEVLMVNDETPARSTAEVRAEIQAMPTPSALVARLEDFAA